MAPDASPRDRRRQQLALLLAVGVVLAAAALHFDALWGRDLARFALIPEETSGTHLGTTSRDDVRFIARTLWHDAHALTTKPWRLYDAGVCWPAEYSLAFGEPMIAYGILAIPVELASGDPTQIDAYSGTGSLFCVAAGRISYFLGLQGPTLAVDTGCSSSLVAIHLACQSLRADECSMAMAGGVHLMLSPEMTIFLSKARALSADGRCKTFDASADGFARGEGCGVVVLKRLSDARRDGDRIVGVVYASCVNQDGKTAGITVPNGPSQEEAVRRCLAQARLQPTDVRYVALPSNDRARSGSGASPRACAVATNSASRARAAVLS